MRTWKVVTPLVLSSGACALVYEVTWLREFRLLFGASTLASATVLALFIGGVGLGSRVLGARVDRQRDPFLLYLLLEAGIALTAAVTPLWLALARHIYLGLGGSTVLGNGGATVVRLLLAAPILLPPTLLMGGTLPALARAAEPERSPGRHITALPLARSVGGLRLHLLLDGARLLPNASAHSRRERVHARAHPRGRARRRWARRLALCRARGPIRGAPSHLGVELLPAGDRPLRALSHGRSRGALRCPQPTRYGRYVCGPGDGLGLGDGIGRSAIGFGGRLSVPAHRGAQRPRAR